MRKRTLKRIALPGIAAMALLGCGAGDDRSSDQPTSTSETSTTTSTTTTAETTTTTTTTAAPRETAGDALKRQIEYLSLGQYSRSYAEIHPAQQALFTADQYERCGPGTRRIEVTNVEIIEEYPEQMVIPGTDLTVDATAVTARVSMNGLTDTDTYREIEVDEQWRFTVIDPQSLIDC